MLSNRSRLLVTVSLGLILFLTHGSPSHAGYVVYVTESGGNVLATGSGTINTFGLVGFDYGPEGAYIQPDAALVVLGDPGNGQGGLYRGITGLPSNFGPGGRSAPTSGTGDQVGIWEGGPFPAVALPGDYVSGSQLNSTDTWGDATFASLGLTPGTYVWTWGSGAYADSFTLNIGTSSVPEPASLMMFGTGSIAILVYARRRKSASA